MYSIVSSNLGMLKYSEASLRSSISGVMGSTSLACWIVLLLPQLIEQWRLKSVEGIAIGFISIWFLGDIANLIGSIWAGLLPEVIFLAIWFCIADFMMVFSYCYYAYIFPKHHPRAHHSQHGHHHHHLHNQNQHQNHHNRKNSRHSIEEHERQPLLNRRASSSSRRDSVSSVSHGVFAKYVLPVIFVIGAGCLGYFLSDSEPEEPSSSPIELGPQIMGYFSAILYLGARIPQIVQNYRRKSVYGLSLLFFLFSVLGNLTYAGQILFYRSDSEYILLNLSWLLGSLGTIFEDSIIFLQFYMYKDNSDKSEFD